MRRRNGCGRCCVAAGVLLVMMGMLLVLADEAESYPFTWIGETGHNPSVHEWNRSKNWSPVGVPDDTSQILVPTGTPWVTVNRTAYANSVELQGSTSQLRIDSGYDLLVNTTVTNNGEIIVGPGRTLSAGTAFTQNTGGFTDLDGTLAVPLIEIGGGYMMGDGWLNGPVTLGGGTLSGNLRMNSLAVNDGTVDAIDLPGQLYNIAVSGLLSMNGGVLDVTGLEGSLGQTFTVLTYGSYEGSFHLITGDPDGGGPLSWKEAYGPNGMTLTATQLPAQLPTPSSLSLIGLGIACLVAVRWRWNATEGAL